MEENMKEIKIEKSIESKNPDMDKADSSPSLVDKKSFLLGRKS